MDLHEFLQQFIALDMAHVAIVALSVGVAVFGLVQGADALWKRSHPIGLSPDIKFWGAAGLSFLIPLGAYVLDNSTQHAPVTFNGVYLAGSVGFATATALHWVTGGSSNAKLAQQTFNTDIPPTPHSSDPPAQ